MNSPLRWVEHLLALAGLAWLVNQLVEALANLAGRSREAAQVDRDVRAVLERLWENQWALQQQAQAGAAKALTPAQAQELRSLAGVASPELERLKRQMQLIRWGAGFASGLVQPRAYRKALVALYADAWQRCVMEYGKVTVEQLRRVVDEAARGGRRPADATEALLFDMTAVYLQACALGAVSARAVSVVPVLLEESVRSPEATGPELFSRWQVLAEMAAEQARPADFPPDQAGG